MKTPPVSKFEQALQKSCKKNTSYSPKAWTKENPLWGHCCVIALIVQDYFGGKILRAPIFSDYANQIGWHFINQLPNSSLADFSRAQYGSNYPRKLRFKVHQRRQLLRVATVVRRYHLLAKRVKKSLARS